MSTPIAPPPLAPEDEIAALRKQIAELTANGVSIHKEVARARDAIVADLRRGAAGLGRDGEHAMSRVLLDYADRYERGDHHGEAP